MERVLLHQHHRSREYIPGTLCMTDRHFIFIEPTGLKETWVMLGIQVKGFIVYIHVGVVSSYSISKSSVFDY